MPPTTKQPNILLVMTDQQRYDTLASHVNNFAARTPHMDALARRGVTFANSFCTSPICGPSRATVMTGQYPSVIGMEGNVGNPSGPLNYNKRTVGHRLQNLGYETVYHGKWHLGGHPSDHGFERVFENSYDPAVTSEAAQFYRNRDWIINKRPFFHVVSYMNPHDIYFLDPDGADTPRLPRWGNQDDTLEDKPWPQRNKQADPRWSDEQVEYYRREYARLVEDVDAEIGRLLRELRCGGFANNTWVIFTSDHGDMAMEHGLPFKGPYCYDGVLHVPMVVAPPDKRALGAAGSDARARPFEPRVTERLTSHVDIVPTILDIAGADDDAADLPGRSLVPVVRDGDDAGPDAVFAEWHQVGKMTTPIRTIRTKQWKYNLYLNIGDELYDLANDPDELHNLAGSTEHAGVRDKLRDQLLRHLEDTGDRFFSFITTDPMGKPHEATGKSDAGTEPQAVR